MLTRKEMVDLITIMIKKNASTEEMERIIKYSQAVINAEKEFAKENIEEIIVKYFVEKGDNE